MLGKISRILKIRVFFFLATVMEDDEKSHDSRINRERSNRATRRAKSFQPTRRGATTPRLQAVND